MTRELFVALALTSKSGNLPVVCRESGEFELYEWDVSKSCQLSQQTQVRVEFQISGRSEIEVIFLRGKCSVRESVDDSSCIRKRAVSDEPVIGDSQADNRAPFLARVSDLKERESELIRSYLTRNTLLCLPLFLAFFTSFRVMTRQRSPVLTHTSTELPKKACMSAFEISRHIAAISTAWH